MAVTSLEGLPAGGNVALADDQAHHLVRVRRLLPGARLEVFDPTGLRAPAVLAGAGRDWRVILQSAPVRPSGQALDLVVYSAIPKGSRADWMVEKLSELGVAALVPLRTERSVVAPGASKLERFTRLAREAARQSEREGIMRIEPSMSLAEAVEAVHGAGRAGAVLSTERAGESLGERETSAIFIGPEGGWSPGELETMLAAGLRPATLTRSILRVETAAVVAAGVLAVRHAALGRARGHCGRMPGP